MSKQQKKSTTTTQASTKLKRQRHVLFGAFLILAALLLFLAIISYFTNWQDDFSTLENFANPDTGIRRIIPDYTKYDLTAYAVGNLAVKKNFLFELGFRYDYNHLDAYTYDQNSL